MGTEAGEAAKSLRLPSHPVVGEQRLGGVEPEVLEGGNGPQVVVGGIERTQGCREESVECVWFRNGLQGPAQHGKEPPKLLVGERYLALVAGHHVLGVVQRVGEVSDHLEPTALAYHLDHLVVLEGLVAKLGGLVGKHLHVPTLKQLRQNDGWLAYQDVEAGTVGALAQATVQVVQALQ